MTTPLTLDAPDLAGAAMLLLLFAQLDAVITEARDRIEAAS